MRGHPAPASSWKISEMQAFMGDLGISKATAHICRFGMTIHDEQGDGLVELKTGFLTNAHFLRKQLHNKCMGTITDMFSSWEARPRNAKCIKRNVCDPYVETSGLH